MNPLFRIHNTHLEEAAKFAELDPHLRGLKECVYVYESPLLTKLPTHIPSIYTVSGGRQIGKTTLLKQWMCHLLAQGIPPETIAFFTGEVIDDHHTLIRLLSEQLSRMPSDTFSFLIVDEVTYIKGWDKGIKFLADASLLENVLLILTGSDLIVMQEARMTFPGRRGRADIVDFHLYPLSFKEWTDLKGIHPDDITALYEAFENYLIHGGFLTAINDQARFGVIQRSTAMTYVDWIRGDLLKRGKRETYIREFLQAILMTSGTQVTWNSLSHHVSIDHPKTLQAYAILLESMDALFIQHALIEDKLASAPKKAKKLFFTDPFIIHALNLWLNEKPLPEKLSEMEQALLVETCVVTHLRRFYLTYYIKAEGEVDVAYIREGTFWPVEVKWTNQIRPKDLKQIQKYVRGRVIGKNKTQLSFHGLPYQPVPTFLYHINS